MAEYNYDNGGFPSSPAVGDRLTIGSAVSTVLLLTKLQSTMAMLVQKLNTLQTH